MKSEMKDTPIPPSTLPPHAPIPKSIPASRDRIQSDLLTGAIGLLLLLKLPAEIYSLHATGSFHKSFYAACFFSLLFAFFVWIIRSATGPAAFMGGIICLHTLMRQKDGFDAQNSAIVPLVVLFVLTFVATRFGRSRKEALGLAERRSGRRASQVIANLGAAGLLASTGPVGSHLSTLGLAACIAALAEATADTVSSEVGQALAASRPNSSLLTTTVLITSGRLVPPGTDGGISLAGTLSGVFAAAIVILLSPFAYTFGPALCIFAGAIAGLTFDSILGATIEHRGWLNNDLVNFTSTVVAAAAAWFAFSLL